jgi:hypothetical protein
MSISVNDNGTWRTINVVSVNDNGTWRNARAVFINENGIWRTVYGNNSGSQSFGVGATSWTVPEGIFSITAVGCGGGGAGGSGDGGANNDGPGFGGGGANLVSSGPIAVTPGQVLNISVGVGGSGRLGGGFCGQPTTVTGTGVNFNVAGGGGGGAWFGWGGPGEISPGVFDTTNRGGFGFNGAGDGGRPGGGGSTNGGSNGGTGGNYNQQPGAAGQGGKLTITF